VKEDEGHRLKALELENGWLKKIVAVSVLVANAVGTETVSDVEKNVSRTVSRTARI